MHNQNKKRSPKKDLFYLFFKSLLKIIIIVYIIFKNIINDDHKEVGKMNVLSIDPGESMIGYSIANEKMVFEWGHIKRKECRKVSKTSEFVLSKLNNIIERHDIQHVIIEINTKDANKYRIDEKEVVNSIISLNLPYTLCSAESYLNHLNLIGYDKRVNNFFKERQNEVFKYFKVKTNSRHNTDCLLMTIFFLQTNTQISI